MDAERLRRIRNIHSDKGYAALIMRPIAVWIMILIADVRWLSANLLTSIGNVLKISGVLMLLLDDRTCALAGVGVMQFGLVFDHLDGTMARYSGRGSIFGSFYDKISDGLTWLVIASVLGWIAYKSTGDAFMIVLATGSAYAMLAQGYMKWVLATEQNKLAWFEAKADPAAAVEQHTKVNGPAGPPERTLGDWFTWAGRSALEMCKWDEIDLYFWVGLFVVLDKLQWLMWALAISQGGHLLVMLVKRSLEARQIDVRRRELT